jgi:Ni,Fe-hydrogenase III small subunit/Fe-S-cluster-containing hydrogenase component 2
MMSGKISIYRFMSAGCNGCDVQILECLVPRYKLAELGVQVVFTPEEANVLAITGGINIKGKEELKKAYEKLKPPKLVVAVGNCAITKEIFDKGYPMVGPPDQIVPVNFYISGCPPRPQAIVTAVATALGATLEEKEDYWTTPEGFRGKHEFDSEKCMGCGACAQVCSSDAIDVLEDNGKRFIKVDYGHCSFCAFCEDECPTEAIKLTREYHLLTDNRNTANVTNEVELSKCTSCGTYFVPTRQIDWALERIENQVSEYKEFHSDLKTAIEICPSCRRKIRNVRNAKKLLSQLSTKIQASG